MMNGPILLGGFTPLPLYTPDLAVRVPTPDELRYKSVSVCIARWRVRLGLPRRQMVEYLISETESFQLEGGGVYARPDGKPFDIDEWMIDVIFGRKLEPAEQVALLNADRLTRLIHELVPTDYRWLDDIKKYAERAPKQVPPHAMMLRYQVIWSAIASSFPQHLIECGLACDHCCSVPPISTP